MNQPRLDSSSSSKTQSTNRVNEIGDRTPPCFTTGNSGTREEVTLFHFTVVEFFCKPIF